MRTILVFLSLVGSSILFSGCPLCDCPDVVPYTRWNSYMIRPDQAGYPTEADSLNFTLEVMEMQYLAQAQTAPSYKGDAAMACSCIDDGWNGFKYPLDSVVFRTSSEWNTDFPAGSSLGDITQIYTYNGDWQNVWMDFDDPTLVSGNNYEYFYYFRFTEGPEEAGEYEVTSTIYYSNGASLDGLSMIMVIQ